MVASGAVDIAPRFQRRDRWSIAKQCALIESFLLNIPVPPIYLAEDELGTYSVIDGKQRITAIKAFLEDEFSLRPLERFPEIAGRSFAMLPRVIQNALDLRPIRSVTLLRQSDQELKYEVFHRLNTGGEVLNPQEIRNVIYRGSLNDKIYELANSPFLRQQLKIAGVRSPSYRNMADAEYVLRFLTLSETWENFSGDLSYSMNLFMRQYRHSNSRVLKEMTASFTRALEACHRIFGVKAFKRAEGGLWRNQALAGMYDAEMVAIGELSESELKRALANQQKVIAGTENLFRDFSFEQAVRQGTNTPSRVKYRVQRMLDMIKEI
jgi:hypothetical protein